MDPRTRLEYALFQLTPTRTRCELVIFAGGEHEKLASGIFQPFVTHLKSVRDQISKGGYSVTLRPSSSAPWFTKLTLQRFVRFVTTPEILERSVTLEKEIEQIEDSIQSNAAAIEGNELDSNHKFKDLSTDGDIVEENSKVGLQRVLETRKAALCKEQAMAYARALVVGFELDYMDDLLCFADAFGASRLREACVSFVELCKRKNEDRMWVDQITAMQAFPRPELSFMGDSGIILAGEENDMLNATNLKHGHSLDAASQGSFESSQEGRAQMAMPWPNHFPHYMQNFQGQGYPPYMYPGMQGQAPYFPGNMQWPGNMGDGESSERSFKKKKSKKKKKKKSKQDESTEPSDDSSVGTESEDGNEGKKSSRKVVIRNINYITKRNGANESDSEESEEEEGFVDGDSIKQQVEAAIGSLGRRHKSSSRRHRKHKSDNHNDDSNNKETKGSDNWAAFQNLLLKDKDSDTEEPLRTSSAPFDMESEVVKKREPPLDDSFLVAKGNEDWGRENSMEKFNANETVRQIRRENNYEEEMLNPGRNGESRSYSQAEMSVFDGKHRARNETEEDWFIRNKADPETEPNLVKTFVGDDFHLKKSSDRDVLTDDSFMIHSRVEGQVEELRLRTDIMDSDVYGTTQNESYTTPEITRHEPDDLFMVLGREEDVTPTLLPWTPEMDFETNTLAQGTSKIDLETVTKASTAEQTSDGKVKKIRGVTKGKDAKPRGSSRPDPASKALRPAWGSRAAASKTKTEMEEERKKRMEELLIQRQKRIAEKSSGAAVSSSVASKKIPPTSKTVKSMIKNEKTPEAAPQSKAKPVLRSSTIERLAAARAAPKVPQQKPVIKRTSKPLGNKTEKTEDKKQSKIGKSGTKSLELSRDPSLEIKETLEDSQSYLSEKQVNEAPASSAVVDFKDIQELDSVPSEETPIGNSQHIENTANAILSPDNQKGETKFDEQETVKKTSVCEDKSDDVKEIKVSEMAKAVSPKKSVTFSETKMEEKHYFSPRVSEIDIVTPPATEADHSRKKWSSEETSPKATAKVFRKLLMFGKKSRS